MMERSIFARYYGEQEQKRKINVKKADSAYSYIPRPLLKQIGTMLRKKNWIKPMPHVLKKRALMIILYDIFGGIKHFIHGRKSLILILSAEHFSWPTNRLGWGRNESGNVRSAPFLSSLMNAYDSFLLVRSSITMCLSKIHLSSWRRRSKLGPVEMRCGQRDGSTCLIREWVTVVLIRSKLLAAIFSWKH